VNEQIFKIFDDVAKSNNVKITWRNKEYNVFGAPKVINDSDLLEGGQWKSYTIRLTLSASQFLNGDFPKINDVIIFENKEYYIVRIASSKSNPLVYIEAALKVVRPR